MLSDSKIRTLKPADKIYRVSDALGLCIEIKPNGKKYWRYRFQWLKKTLMMGLGEYPIVGLAEARRKRDDAKGLLADGLNPIDQKNQALKDMENQHLNLTTFKHLAEEYLSEKLSNKSPTHIGQFTRSMKKDIYKVIGDKDIKAVSSADVVLIMKNTVKRIKKQKNHGTGEVTAMQARQNIGAVMRYAIAMSKADYDPTYAVKGIIERPEIEHARPLTNKECRKLRSKMEGYGGSVTVKNAVLCMIYSMLRTIEIRRMKWEYVDFDNKTITFPAKSKTQTRTMKMNRIHVVPMSDQVFNIISQQYSNNPNAEYVFPSVYRDGMLSPTTLNRVLQYIEMGGVSAHDFRATASTMLNEKGYDEDWIEKQLAHADDNKTRASYNHAKYLDDRRKMLQDWADIVDGWKD